MSNIYNFDTIARTAGNGNGLTSFDKTPSINDFGLVAFVGKLNGSEELFVGDSSNAITNLSTSPLFNGSFFSGIEINNDNQIVAVNSGAIRLWDADNPGFYRKTVGTAIFGNEFSNFDNIFPFASINNVTPPQSEESEVVFNADPKDGISNTSVGLHTYKPFGGENTYFEGALANSIGIPMLADDGRVVSKVDNSTIRVFNYGLNQNQIIASDASLGRAPGISDNGKAVAFYGDDSGEGIFISVETDSGWERHRIAGAVGNGVLDPGETYEDTNNNGSFDSGDEENGLIGSFAPNERIGINYREIEDGGLGTVTYLAQDSSGNESLISSQFNISSSSEPNVRHSLIAKVGQSANKVDTALTGNIQDLNIYDPINDPGQIAFWAKTTTGKEAIVRANPIRKPIFIVPGIIGSLPKNEDVNEWLTNRGFSPDRLQPEQISNIYDDLIETLKRAGYVEGVDLFVATYDWRLNPAPIDGTIDGVINRSVEDLTDDTYEYSVDQFAFWLKEAITGWKSQFSDLPESEIPELDSVDVIAHSAGGATVRSYIQSDAYGEVFDQNGTKLPEINNFISLGVPYRGASIPWNGLNNNFSGGVVLQLAKLIAGAAYAKAQNGSTISFSGQNDVPEAITPQEVNTGTVKEFIEDYVPHLRALLATYPFIEDSSGNLKKAEELDPLSRNELLLDLNDGFDSINNEGGGNPTKFADKIGQLAVVYGSGNPANDALLQKTGPDFEQVLDVSNPTPSTPVNVPIPSIATLNRGKVAPKADEIWYENLPKGEADLNKQGDKTVPLLSATGFFSNDPNNPNYRDNILPLKDFASVTHNQQPFDLEVQKYILDILNISLEENLISTNLNETSNPDIPGLAFDAITFAGEFKLDPVEGFLVDNQGRRLGYTSATGAVTEIPNSYWLGNEDGIGFFTEPVNGPFHLELTGLGEEYYVSVELETEEGQAFLESEGFLAAGEQLTLDVPVNNAPILDLNGDADGIDASASVSENGGTFSIVDNSLTINDSESQNLAGAMVTIQNPLNGNSELLAATATGNITVDYNADTSTLTLAGTDTIANYQQVLSSVTYTNNAVNPDNTPREISFVVDDGAGFNNLSPVATVNTLFLPDGSNGQQTFVIAKDSGTTTIFNFGGVGMGRNPDPATLAQVDTLKFEGDGLTANNLQLNQSGNNLIVNFKGIDNTEVILANFTIEDLDNLPNQIGNILFNGQSVIQDSIDVFDPEETQSQVFGTNKVTFLDGLNNSVNGLDNSNDVINGQNGDDLINGKDGNDILNGGDGDDTLVGNAGDDTLDGGTGSDRFLVFSNHGITLTDTQVTGDGTDAIALLEYAHLTGDNQSNSINASSATEISTLLKGNGGYDTLQGGEKNDTILGGYGNDVLIGNGGDDILNGQGGSDRFLVFSNHNITLTDTQVTGDGTDAISNIEYAHLTGDNQSNSINASSATEISTIVKGNGGYDTLQGGEKNDTILGGYGNDVLIGNGGDDILNGQGGSDRLFVTSDNDITLTDTQVVGDGTDTIISVEDANLNGGAGDNDIRAGGVTNIQTVLRGNDGNDTLNGGGKNDTLNGGAGDDILAGNGGDDTLNGEAGSDRLYIASDNNITLTDTQVIGDGTDTITNIELASLVGRDNNSIIDASSATNISVLINANGGADTLNGGDKNDTLNGGNGNDILVGNAGNDLINGQGGSDRLFGGTGDDRLSGGNGNDTLNGGAGADIFILEAVFGTDVINDFSDGVDSFGLKATLDFSDLAIVDNVAGTATLIRDTTSNNQLLGIINNVSANDITVEDFTEI